MLTTIKFNVEILEDAVHLDKDQDLQRVMDTQMLLDNFHSSGAVERLEPTMEIGLYRIAQEALNNIAKHAEADEANVQLIGDSRTIRLTVDDNGKGFRIRPFDPGKGERHGLGLVSMRERTVSFNGVFTIHSMPGRGTEIIVEIPLTDSKDHG